MTNPTIIHATAIVEKSYAKSPAQVFAAFADPAKKRRWYADRTGSALDAFEMDFRTGGNETLVYRLGPNTPLPGARIANRETFQDIVPDRRIVMTSSSTIEGRCFSVSLVTFEVLATDRGCDLVCTHQDAFFEGSDGPELRAKGWQDLLSRLDQDLLG
jgi:uncharacterized protein YndB with AHSA1/START domain